MILPSIELPKGNKGCIMQWVAILSGEEQLGQQWGKVTDQPSCTNEVITASAIRLNDRLSDAERQRLWVLLPRIERARKTSADRRVNVRLAIWAAESVFELIPKDKTARKAIDTARAWLEGTATAEDCRTAANDAAAVYVANDAAYYYAASAVYAAAVYVANDAAYYAAADAADAHAAYYAAAAAADAAAIDPILWLSDLLDAHEKACSEEGVLHELYASLCFVGSQAGGS